MVEQHIHRLKRGRYRTGTYYFKCGDCPFIAVDTQVIGRVTRCWKCGEPFCMNRNDIKWAKPVCPTCRNKPEMDVTNLVSAVDDAIMDILKEDKK
jgi:formylmethanofuran dehydrogenase subunit E